MATSVCSGKPLDTPCIRSRVVLPSAFLIPFLVPLKRDVVCELMSYFSLQCFGVRGIPQSEFIFINDQGPSVEEIDQVGQPSHDLMLPFLLSSFSSSDFNYLHSFPVRCHVPFQMRNQLVARDFDSSLFEC